MFRIMENHLTSGIHYLAKTFNEHQRQNKVQERRPASLNTNEEITEFVPVVPNIEVNTYRAVEERTREALEDLTKRKKELECSHEQMEGLKKLQQMLIENRRSLKEKYNALLQKATQEEETPSQELILFSSAELEQTTTYMNVNETQIMDVAKRIKELQTVIEAQEKSLQSAISVMDERIGEKKKIREELDKEIESCSELTQQAQKLISGKGLKA